MVMRYIGKRIMKGYFLRERIKFGFGVFILRLFVYSVFMYKIEEINVGEILLVREILCIILFRD